MDEYNDIELGVRLLPGVDLTLWLRIIVAVLLLVGIGGTAIALS